MDSSNFSKRLLSPEKWGSERHSSVPIIIIIIHNTIKFQLHHSMQIILFNAYKYTSWILLGYVTSNTSIEESWKMNFMSPRNVN